MAMQGTIRGVSMLDKLSETTLKNLPEIQRKRDKSFKIMLLNRSRKVVFVELKTFDNQANTKIHSCMLPEDCFVLAFFDENNLMYDIKQAKNYFVNLSLKEVFFYGKEMHDLDWLYEGDFRKKDSFFYLIQEY